MSRLGVALGSGGAATMAHVGVLEALCAAGLSIEQVSGSSGGAIVGAVLGTGALSGFRDAMEGLSRRRVLSLFDPRWPRLGMLEGRRAMDFIKPYVAERFEDLTLPFAAVATDLDTAESIVLREGNLASAIRASIAIPGIFTPSLLSNRVLVDGALSDPIPVRAARDLGARFVLAVNVLPLTEDVLRRARPPAWGPLALASRAWESIVPAAVNPSSPGDGDAGEQPLDPDERRGLVDVILRASHVAQCHIAALGLRAAPPDYLLTVPVPAVGLFEFQRAAELIQLGRDAAIRELPEILAALYRADPLARRLARWVGRGSPPEPGPEPADGAGPALSEGDPKEGGEP